MGIAERQEFFFRRFEAASIRAGRFAGAGGIFASRLRNEVIERATERCNVVLCVAGFDGSFMNDT